VGPRLALERRRPGRQPGRADQEDLNELGDRLNKANDAKQNEIKQKIRSDGRNAVLEDFMEAWRNRVSLDAFMQEKRATELYAAMRVCDASEDDRYDLGDQRHWVHRSCDHRLRMLDARAAVKLLPEELLGKVIEVLDGTTVPDREAGNSAAPESSSVSSEPADPAEASTPSTPDETRADVPTT
jgi:hypothetical protein